MHDNIVIGILKYTTDAIGIAAILGYNHFSMAYMDPVIGTTPRGHGGITVVVYLIGDPSSLCTYISNFFIGSKQLDTSHCPHFKTCQSVGSV